MRRPDEQALLNRLKCGDFRGDLQGRFDAAERAGLGASVHSARGSFRSNEIEARLQRRAASERGRRSIPNAISAITGCGIAISDGAVGQPFNNGGGAFISAETAFVSRT